MNHVTLQHALRSLAAHIDTALKADPTLPCLPDAVIDVHTRDGRATVRFEPGQDVAIEWARHLHVETGRKLTLTLVDESTGEVSYEFAVGEQDWRFDSVPDGEPVADDNTPICYTVVAGDPEPFDLGIQETQVLAAVRAVQAA